MTIAWTMQSALVFIAIALWIGDVVASLTKARVPSILIIAIIFVVGYWTILPQDFLDIALIPYFYQFVNFIIMVHIGTLFNLRELKSEWKVVVITLAAVVGIVITVYFLGQYVPWVGKAQALALYRRPDGGPDYGRSGQCSRYAGARNPVVHLLYHAGLRGFPAHRAVPQERGNPCAG